MSYTTAKAMRNVFDAENAFEDNIDASFFFALANCSICQKFARLHMT